MTFISCVCVLQNLSFAQDYNNLIKEGYNCGKKTIFSEGLYPSENKNTSPA